MEWLANNWILVISGIAILVMSTLIVIDFIKMPKAKQRESLKKLLRALVVKAELEFGSGTGELKLAQVYAWAVAEYPWVAVLLTYEQFDEYVKNALEWMKKQLETNPSFKAYLEG